MAFTIGVTFIAAQVLDARGDRLLPLGDKDLDDLWRKARVGSSNYEALDVNRSAVRSREGVPHEDQ